MSEGCLLELGGLGPQRPYAHLEHAWERLGPGSSGGWSSHLLPECKIKAERIESLNPSTTILAVWASVRYLTSLNFIFVTCKIRIIVLPSGGC